MSIRALSYVILVLIAVFGAFVITSALSISRNSDEAEQFWIDYQDISSPRADAFRSLVKAMGYGGMIDQFKRFVLRKEDELVPKVRVSVGKVLAAVEKYRETTINAEVDEALRKISRVALTYGKGIERAQQMADEGYSARQIQRVVLIDDEPAIESLEVLAKDVRTHRVRKDDRASRFELLGQLHRKLGYGGLIHQLDDYVLSQDKALAEELTKTLAELRRIIDAYRALGPNPAETMALNQLSEGIASYGDRLALAQRLVGERLAPEEIDRRVRMDGKVILSALQMLAQENSQHIVMAKLRTTEQLDSNSRLSSYIMFGSAGGLALLILLIGYVLLFHILRPIRRITDTVAQFIEGDLNVEFHGTDRKDELGYLARVIDKLRVILINYALRNRRAQRPPQAPVPPQAAQQPPQPQPQPQRQAQQPPMPNPREVMEQT